MIVSVKKGDKRSDIEGCEVVLNGDRNVEIRKVGLKVNNQPVLITVGLIAKPHNFDGSLKVIPITDYPERFLKRKEILVDLEGTVILKEILEVSIQKKYIIIKLKDINSFEEAEKYKGCYLKIPESQLEELDEGNYYIFELIGMKVFDNTGKQIGELKQVLNTSANDVFVIKTNNNKEILIPALKKEIQKIDLKNRKIIVSDITKWI